MFEVIIRIFAITVFRIPVALIRWTLGGFSRPFDTYLKEGHWRTEGLIGIIIVGLIITLINTIFN